MGLVSATRRGPVVLASRRLHVHCRHGRHFASCPTQWVIFGDRELGVALVGVSPIGVVLSRLTHNHYILNENKHRQETLLWLRRRLVWYPSPVQYP
jgi:hypothetical protein